MNKVVCVKDSSGLGSITIGKCYDILNLPDRYVNTDKKKTYALVNDFGKMSIYYRSDFKLLSDIRDERIKYLLNE